MWILILQELTPTPLFRPCKKAICKQSFHKGQAPEIVLGNCLNGIWCLSGFWTKAERRQRRRSLISQRCLTQFCIQIQSMDMRNWQCSVDIFWHCDFCEKTEVSLAPLKMYSKFLKSTYNHTCALWKTF